MNKNTKKYLVLGVLALVIIVPRIALLTNGLDSQRIWDTNTPAAFRLLSALNENKLGEFFATDEKYPLLGSYAYTPVIVGYYGIARIFGVYKSSTDFINAYALGETDLFFWIRLEMILINLVALYLLYRLTKKFSGNARAPIYVIALAAVNFFVTLFSVEPRIHSWSFLATTVVLYASFLLLRNKTLRNYLLAFGAAGLAASVSQSGFVAIILPILAHFFDEKRKHWSLVINKTVCFSLIIYLATVVFLGYPRFFAAVVSPSISLKSVFLSGEHTQPIFGLSNIFSFIRSYTVSSDLTLDWWMLAGLWYLLCARNKRKIHFTYEDALATAHIALFFLIFGFSGVLTGRFTLTILPSLFFVLARIIVQLERRRKLVFVGMIFFVIQIYGIFQLTRVAFHTDTRSDAAQYLLAHSNDNDKILGTLSPVLLGIIPAPHSIDLGDIGAVGATETLIAKNDLVGKKTRQYALWNIAGGNIVDEMLKSYRYVVVAVNDPYRYRAEDMLLRNNFSLVKNFSNQVNGNVNIKASIPWDEISPPPDYSWPFALRKFEAFGPSVVIYQKLETGN